MAYNMDPSRFAAMGLPQTRLQSRNPLLNVFRTGALSKPGMGNMLQNIGFAAMLAGEGGQPVGTSRLGRALPFLQQASRDIPEARAQAFTREYQQAKLADIKATTKARTAKPITHAQTAANYDIFQARNNVRRYYTRHYDPANFIGMQMSPRDFLQDKITKADEFGVPNPNYDPLLADDVKKARTSTFGAPSGDLLNKYSTWFANTPTDPPEPALDDKPPAAKEGSWIKKIIDGLRNRGSTSTSTTPTDVRLDPTARYSPPITKMPSSQVVSALPTIPTRLANATPKEQSEWMAKQLNMAPAGKKYTMKSPKTGEIHQWLWNKQTQSFDRID